MSLYIVEDIHRIALANLIDKLKLGPPSDDVQPQAVVRRKTDWRNSISSKLRVHLVHKVLHEIFPNTADAAVMVNPRMLKLLVGAKTIEDDIYAEATSRSEYYRLLAVKIYRIRMDMDDSRRTLIERQHIGGAELHLLLLLHAQKCARCEPRQVATFGKPCTMRHCGAMKDVLRHMMLRCKMRERCPVAYCWSSHQIIMQWKSCVISCLCAVCAQSRLAKS